VIHSRIPVLLEVSGGAALTFDPESPAELADALRRVSQDAGLRDDLRQRGRQRAAALTWDAALTATLEVYRELLARHVL
jgi:glycosyltransferase involved in cell wall biosynthesis